jgi:hypothetical protein
MGHQSLQWNRVLGALCAAGVPAPLGVKIVAILADAGFEGRTPSSRSNKKPPGAFAPVPELERPLMKRMEAEQSRLETCKRQAGYSYARLAVLQMAGVGASDA